MWIELNTLLILLRLAFVTVFSTFLLISAKAQDFGILRTRIVALSTDTIRLDTLSIIPESFTIKTLSGGNLDASLYRVNFGRAELFIHPDAKGRYNQLIAEYRVFPVLFEREYYKRDYQQSLSPDSLMGRERTFYPSGYEQDPLFGEQIQTNGSIMRGIRFGNNQDVSVNSSMNLRFSGELSNDLMIEGAISDQSVPLQPDGTTRRLDEFDRVYLHVYRKDFSVQAGDIVMRSGGEGQLLTFQRNVQGLAYKGISEKEKDTLIVNAALAVPKGKFSRNQIQGVEGNQGPYRLFGTDGEVFIIIISGSERVYVDGVLLTRGEDEHYTIDYNAATVSFTHRMPVNRSSRIIVEFEYSERSYARFNTVASVEQKGGKWQWFISAFSEQDSRNQPFDQELTDEQKRHLSQIGDNLDLAFYPQEDRVEFDPEKILYQKKDTLVNSVVYSIFVHSTNPTHELYRVYFSYVGQGKGNYQPDFGTANGRVFRWVAPINGIHQGSYEPVKRLVAPQKRQMIHTGLSRGWGKGSSISASYALSNTDLNTFSDLDSDDDIGHGLQLAVEQRFALDTVSSVGVGANLLKTSHGFRAIDRFRPSEFERDWGIGVPLFGGNEQMLGLWTELKKPQKIITRIAAENLQVADWYNGTRGRIGGWNKNSILNTSWDGSWVSASDTSVNIDFYKARIGLNRQQGFLNYNLVMDYENSIVQSIETDSLLTQGFSWYQTKASVATPDTLKLKSKLSYLYRDDYKPQNGASTLVGTSQEVVLASKLEDEKVGIIVSSFGYRIFHPNKQFFLSEDEQVRTILSRIEYSNRFFKNFLTLSGGYELGSGLEPDMEFYFVEVPAGQGVYTWVDYNGNGIMELNEFEIANFPDEARFIRINIPGARMITVRNNAFSVRGNINAGNLIKGKEGFAMHLGRLSNQSAYRIQQKNQHGDFFAYANPFVHNAIDTLLVSMSANFRNSIAYNRTSRLFGIEYEHISGTSKSVLANGYEMRENLSNRLIIWFGFLENFSARTQGEKTSKTSKSQYFTMRNFAIEGYNAQQSVKYLTEMQHSFEVGYKWEESANDLGEGQLTAHTIFSQVDLSFLSKGAIMAKATYITNNFLGNAQSAVGYEMLKGLQPGKNLTWEVAVKRRLTRLLELELGYNGRYLNDGKTIHSGYMQARAIF